MQCKAAFVVLSSVGLLLLDLFAAQVSAALLWQFEAGEKITGTFSIHPQILRKSQKTLTLVRELVIY